MKFSLFTEIQCPTGTSPHIRLNEFLEQAELADRLGFHGFWIAEIHCQPRFSLLSTTYVGLGGGAPTPAASSSGAFSGAGGHARSHKPRADGLRRRWRSSTQPRLRMFRRGSQVNS